MRIRSVLAVALLLPSITSAQARRPRIGGARPEVAPLGPQPEVIARSQAIVRSKLSVETYPMFNRVIAPGLMGARPISSWNNFGNGTHLDYRHTEWLSSTLDMTASFLSGPSNTETIEAGFRFRPTNWEHRVRPFADARFGFEHASDQYGGTTNEIGLGATSSNYRYSRGFGGIAGIGMEVPVSNSWSIQSEALAMRTNMNAYSYEFTRVPSASDNYRMTTYRLTLGLRYNRANFVQTRETVASQSLH